MFYTQCTNVYTNHRWLYLYARATNCAKLNLNMLWFMALPAVPYQSNRSVGVSRVKKNCRWYYLLVLNLYFIQCCLFEMQCTICSVNYTWEIHCELKILNALLLFSQLNEYSITWTSKKWICWCNSAGLDLTLYSAIRLTLIHRNMSHMITFGNSSCISGTIMKLKNIIFPEVSIQTKEWKI